MRKKTVYATLFLALLVTLFVTPAQACECENLIPDSPMLLGARDGCSMSIWVSNWQLYIQPGSGYWYFEYWVDWYHSHVDYSLKKIEHRCRLMRECWPFDVCVGTNYWNTERPGCWDGHDCVQCISGTMPDYAVIDLEMECNCGNEISGTVTINF